MCSRRSETAVTSRGDSANPLRQVDLLVGRQQRHLPDLAQVEAQRVERGLDGQVELRWLLRVVVWERGLLVRRMFVLLPLNHWSVGASGRSSPAMSHCVTLFRHVGAQVV
jgi:hypothetical protein